MVLSKRRELFRCVFLQKNTGGCGCGGGNGSRRGLLVKKAEAEKPHWDWGCCWYPGVRWW